MQFQWNVSVEDVAAANMARCESIQECRRQLEHWKTRLSQLMAEHRAAVQAAVLYRNPSQWNRLKRKEKWEPANVKAVLSSPNLQSKDVPQSLLDWSLTPPHIRGDKELFLLRLGCSSACPPVENYLPPVFQTIRPVLTTIMECNPVLLANTLPSDSFVWSDYDMYGCFWKSIYLSAGSQNHHCDDPLDRFQYVLLKFDFLLRNHPQRMLDTMKELMVHTTASDAYPYWKSLLQTCFTNRPQPDAPLLRNRTEVAAFLLGHHGDLLQHFSRRIKDDKELVTTAVQQDGSALRFASYRMRRDEHVVAEALQNDPTALVHALHRKRLIRSDVKYALEFFEHRPLLPSSKQYQSVWEMIPGRYKENASVLVAAVSCNVTIEDESLLARVDWPAAVEKYPQLWIRCGEHRLTCLPRTMDCSEGELADVLHECAELQSNRDFWLLVAQSGILPYTYYQVLVPRLMLTDRDITIAACHQDVEVLELLIDHPLAVDRDVLEAAFDNNAYDALQCMAGNAQVLHPDLVARAIAAADEDCLWELYDCIDEDVWMNREVAVAWLEAGGDYLQNEFPDEFEEDQEIFMLVAQHCPQDFCCVSDDLRCNEAFMQRVIEVNPMLLRELDQCDEMPSESYYSALTLTACAANRDVPSLFDFKSSADLAWFSSFASQVRKQLECHRAFTQVLAGIQCASAASPLHQLNQGTETCTGLKQLLGEFVGVPMGTELKKLRRASLHMSQWGY